MGCEAPNDVHADLSASVKTAYPLVAALKAALTCARRPVPIGWTGARRFLVYWPALLCECVVPAIDPLCGTSRNFIISLYCRVDYARVTPGLRLINDCKAILASILLHASNFCANSRPARILLNSNLRANLHSPCVLFPLGPIPPSRARRSRCAPPGGPLPHAELARFARAISRRERAPFCFVRIAGVVPVTRPAFCTSFSMEQGSRLSRLLLSSLWKGKQNARAVEVGTQIAVEQDACRA